MIEHEFLKELAGIITKKLMSKKYRFWRREVSTIGHFNYRVFQPEGMFRQKASNFIRMLINMAMGMQERDFRYMCWRMVDRIIEAAESMEGDIINAEHESPKKRNK